MLVRSSKQEIYMLVAMQNSEATMGNSIDTYVPAIPEVDIHPKIMNTLCQRDTLCSAVIVFTAYCSVWKIWNQLSVPHQMNGWWRCDIYKSWNMHNHKKMNPVIWSNMNASRRYDINWNKTERSNHKYRSLKNPQSECKMVMTRCWQGSGIEGVWSWVPN